MYASSTNVVFLLQTEKILTISGKIATNDLKAKTHSLDKWLKKGHQVKVTLLSRGCKPDDLVRH